MKADAYHLKRIQNADHVARLEAEGFDRGEIAAMVGLSRSYIGQLLMEHQRRVIQLRNRPVVEHQERLSDVARDPEMQATIKRIGESVSDINAVSIDRTQYVLGVASVVREARLRT